MDATPPPKQMQLALASRIKIMSSLDIAERRLPQDGRMRVKVSGKDFDLRVSFLPTVHGEKMRAARARQIQPLRQHRQARPGPDTFKQFKSRHGRAARIDPRHRPDRFRQDHHALFRAQRTEQPAIQHRHRRRPGRIPDSRHQPGADKKEIGLTFANALRSILRQDPDIIMIGEIRDTETAEIAIEAALTGHQVLSTMHCNDAPGAIARLDDMGIAPFLISSSVILPARSASCAASARIARSR
jgi:type II secretory ATPase GspE/PulE/Tfp pilus assembly ATPase PilB-like protein